DADDARLALDGGAKCEPCDGLFASRGNPELAVLFDDAANAVPDDVRAQGREQRMRRGDRAERGRARQEPHADDARADTDAVPSPKTVRTRSPVSGTRLAPWMRAPIRASSESAGTGAVFSGQRGGG